MVKEYIYINENSLSKDLCDEIINKFQIEKTNNNTNKGVTGRGLNINVKDTNDFLIEMQNEWKDIRKCLEFELVYNLKKYTKQVNTPYSDISYNVVPQQMFFKTFQLQEYLKNEGLFIYHDDGMYEENYSYRVLTYIWYLNDVEQGGETEICLNYKIKPTKGKLLIFPASWMYPHCGKMPISSNKYIITGWIYTGN